MPAIQPYVIKPILSEQVGALLRERKVEQPLGYHRPAYPIGNREAGREVLVFGCAYSGG